MKKLNTKEIVVFALLGVIMFVSKILMEFLPNIHLLAPLIIAYTVVFRKKALIPIYVFVFLVGFVNGFSTWILFYVYIWPILWGAIMLLSKNMPQKTAFFVYCIIAGMHGFLFGTLCAPAQAIMFGLNFKGMVAWIIAGIPFDIVHGIGNIFASMLTIPIINALKKAVKTN